MFIYTRQEFVGGGTVTTAHTRSQLDDMDVPSHVVDRAQLDGHTTWHDGTKYVSFQALAMDTPAVVADALSGFSEPLQEGGLGDWAARMDEQVRAARCPNSHTTMLALAGLAQALGDAEGFPYAIYRVMFGKAMDEFSVDVVQ